MAPGPLRALTLRALMLFAAGGADAVLVERAAAVLVGEHDRRAVGCVVAVAELHQRDHHGPQVEALVGQAVLEALGALLVGDLGQDALLMQALQALR